MSDSLDIHKFHTMRKKLEFFFKELVQCEVENMTIIELHKLPKLVMPQDDRLKVLFICSSSRGFVKLTSPRTRKIQILEQSNFHLMHPKLSLKVEAIGERISLCVAVLKKN